VFRLVRSGADLLVFVNSDTTPSQTIPFASAPAITFNGLEGTDTLVLDYGGGSPLVPAAGVTFNGNGAVDRVRVLAASAGDAFTVAPGSVAHAGDGTATFATVEILDLRTGSFISNADAAGLSIELAGAGTVTFNASQTLAGLTLSSGSLATLTPGGTKLIDAQSLSIAGGSSATATLDLNDGDLIVRGGGGAGLSTVSALIASARNAGTWTGLGVTSSSARDNPTHNTTLGVMLGADYTSISGGAVFHGSTIGTGDVLVKYTYYGDANFSGTVNFDDYVRTDVGFNTHLTGWSNGDFNGSGAVDFDDYVLIDIAFNTQGAPLRRGPTDVRPGRRPK
jgi:hypothetical protein